MLKYLLIRNCRLLSPDYEDQQVDVLTCENRIIEIGNNITQPSIATTCIEAEGRILLPSLIDLRTNLSVPTAIDTGTHQTLQSLVSMGIGVTLTSVKLQQLTMEYVSLARQEVPTVNYGCHFTLTSLQHGDLKDIKRYKVEYGIPTAYHKLVTNGMGNQEKLFNAIDVAREAGLRIILDIEKDGSTIEHLHILGDVCNYIGTNTDNDVLFVGVKYREEVDFIEQLRQRCNVRMQLNFSTLAPKNKQLHHIDIDSMIQYVRNYSWCSIGVIDLGMRMRTLQSNNVQDDNHWYNTLSLLTSLSSENRVTLQEAIVAVIQRNADFCGLGNKYAQLRVGSAANLLLWNDMKRMSISISDDDSTLNTLNIKGCIDYAILNGSVIYAMNEPDVMTTNIAGTNVYRRIIKNNNRLSIN